MKAHPLYARRVETERYQTLPDHLEHVADYAADFASGFPNTARAAGILHDIGKASRAFQDYLKDEKGIRGSVVHSLQGAFCVSEIPVHQASDVLAKELLELVIAAHHGGLADALDLSGDRSFFEKMAAKNQEMYYFEEVKSNLPDLHEPELFHACIEEIRQLLQCIKQHYTNRDSANFALGLFAKYIYSCLIDADRLDAYLFESRKPYAPASIDWKTLTSRFEQEIAKKPKNDPINQIRAEISEKCKHAGGRDTGIYRLSLPTGSGKTLSSFRFALHHALKTGKKRIIYVIPYLSITTQTAGELRDILKLEKDSDLLLEHYSSVAAPETEEENEKRKLATARWDNPIIVTTMVQFLETVMSAKGSDLRKFHHMQDSVIIFDEIQSLPINCVHLFNEIVSFLSKILHTTVLLCTATQPTIDKTFRHNLLLSEQPDLIPDYQKYHEMLRRTRIVACSDEKTIDEFSSIVYEKAVKNRNCLCIVNLKSQAREIYQTIKALDEEKTFQIIHLSTSMCGEHRREQLALLKKLLKSRKKVICISTQLIEAGVDISFACVVRAMAGLDSILQAAGRCNRNGEAPELQPVYTYPIQNERGIEKLRDIQIGKEITQKIIRENPDADYLDEHILNEFYRYYFYERVREMDYHTKDGATVYDMLSCNDNGRGNYKNRTGQAYSNCLAQAFDKVGKHFFVIPDLTRTVVVYHGESEKLLDAFKTADMGEKIKLLHLLQDYTVGLFDYEFGNLEKARAISLFDEEFGIYVLNREYYSQEYGVNKNAEMPNHVV